MKNKVYLYNSLLLLMLSLSIFILNIPTKAVLMVSFMIFILMNLRFLAKNIKLKLHRAASFLIELEKEVRSSNNKMLDLNSLLVGAFLIDVEFYKKYHSSAFNTLWVWQNKNPVAPMIISLLEELNKKELRTNHTLNNDDKQILISVLNQIRSMSKIEMDTLLLEQYPQLIEYKENQRIILNKLVA